jgi:hypothetical protein
MIRPIDWMSGLGVLVAVACTQSYDSFDFSGTTTSPGGTGGTTTTSLGGGGTGAIGGGGTGATGGTTAGGTGGTGGSATGGQGGAAGSPTVPCDGSPCDVSGNGVCCLQQTGSTESCEPSGSCDSGYTVVHCDGPEDCAGQTCCGHFDGGNDVYTELVCAPSCQGSGSVVICGSSEEICQGGTSCQNSSHLPNTYYVCRN